LSRQYDVVLDGTAIAHLMSEADIPTEVKTRYEFVRAD
jgi:hypothetical protein